MGGFLASHCFIIQSYKPAKDQHQQAKQLNCYSTITYGNVLIKDFKSKAYTSAKQPEDVVEVDETPEEEVTAEEIV